VELLRTVQSVSICRLALRYSDVGDVDVLVCTVDTGDTSGYTQDGGTAKYLCGCQKYVLVLKHCTIVAQALSAVRCGGITLSCLGKCLLKRNVVHC
jgi:hypothetical protein